MRLYDLKEKEVINICDCRRLGFVSDVVFEFPSAASQPLSSPVPAISAASLAGIRNM